MAQTTLEAAALKSQSCPVLRKKMALSRPELRDSVKSHLAEEVKIKSFDQKLPKVKQIENSIDKIEEHVLRDKRVAIYPMIDDDHGLLKLLEKRLLASNGAGLAYVAKCLAVSANIIAKPKPDIVIFDVCLMSNSRPTVILSVVKNTKNAFPATLYNLSLAKSITEAVRKFTDEHFSAMYGLLTASDLADQQVFDNLLFKIKRDLSRICIPDSLSMTDVKYKKVVRAFLYSVSATSSVLEEGDTSETLWMLTFNQFWILTENIDKKVVTITCGPHSGTGVLLREVACRLEKSGPTLLLLSTKSKEITDARKNVTCSEIYSLDELQNELKNGKFFLNIENIVTDCQMKEVDELQTLTGNKWYFCQDLGNTEAETTSEMISECQEDTCEDNQDGIAVDDGKIGIAVDTVSRSKSICSDGALSAQGQSDTNYIGSVSNVIGDSKSVDLELKYEDSTGKNIACNQLVKTQRKDSAEKDTGHQTDTDLDFIMQLESARSREQENQLQIHYQQNLLQSRTKGEIEAYTINAVLPEVLAEAKNRLARDKVITITGMPGEGKTTMAYLLLKELEKSGWKPMVLKRPSEHNCILEFSKRVFLLNDIFGSLHFDQNLTMKWLPVIDDLHKYMLSHAEVLLIFVSRDYILSEARLHLSRISSTLISERKILDISKEFPLSDNDKINIFSRYKNQSIDRNDNLQKLVKSSFPFGFPYCSFLYFNLENVHENTFDFFKNAKEFLDKTTQTMLNADVYKKAAFYLLLYQEGYFSSHDISPTDIPTIEQKKLFHVLSTATHADQTNLSLKHYFHQLLIACKHLEGCYLKKAEDTITFSHAAFYESVTRVVGKTDAAFLVEHCSLNFTSFADDMPVEIVSMLAGRLISEINRGNISLSLSHKLFTTQFGVREFMKTDIDRLIEKKDMLSGKSFLNLVPSSKSDELLVRIVKTMEVSKEMFADLLNGCCEFGNMKGLKYLLTSYPLYHDQAVLSNATDIALQNRHTKAAVVLINIIEGKEDEKYDYNANLLAASAYATEDVLALLLERGACINAVDKEGKSALYYSCKHGNGKCAEFLISRGISITTKDESFLHTAVRGCHISCVKSLVDKGFDVNAKGENGDYVLHVAVSTGNDDIVSFLLKQNCDTNVKRMDGKTSLHIAASSGYEELTVRLLQSGSDTNIQDKEGHTALHDAVLHGQLRITNILIECGAEVEAVTNKGWTPICLAARKGYCNVISTLIQKGANVDGFRNFTALHIACQNHHLQTVMLLLQKGANINRPVEGSGTPIIFASEQPINAHLVEYLITNGANVKASSKDGRSILHQAIFSGNTNLVHLLIMKGADVQKKDNNGVTALMIAAYMGKYDLIQPLVRAGAHVNSRHKNGMTSIAYAARNGHAETLYQLIKAGGSVDLRDANGCFPLHHAVSRKHLSVVTKLIDLGVNINCRAADDKTPLMFACNMGNIDIARCLVAGGADLNLTDNRNWSCYHFAAQSGQTDVMIFLLQRFEHLNIQTIEGATAFQIALVNGNVDIVNMLLNAKCNPYLSFVNGDNALHSAAMGGNRQNIMTILALGININSTSNKKETPLHVAVCKGKTDIVQELLDRGANVNATELGGNSAIIFASKGNNYEVLKLLINRGANVNHVPDDGLTALYLACVNERKDTVSVLLEAGADTNAYTMRGMTPLHISALKGNKVIVKELLKHNCSKDLLTPFGMHAGDFAILSGNIDLVHMLLMPLKGYFAQKLWYFRKAMIYCVFWLLVDTII